MKHITLTGYYAGTTVCGAAKGIEGDTYAHAGDWIDNPEITMCPKCREVWDSLDDEDSEG